MNSPSHGLAAAPDRSNGVIWITGYSAAGKTTIGREVARLLSQEGHHVIFLDGDQLRSIFSQKWGYSREERVELACTYFRLCSHLSKQGSIVVISAVAMFDEARHWFRQNVDNGMEVYLRVPLSERMTRDASTKRIYQKSLASMEHYDEPVGADVVIDNHGAVRPEEASRTVIEAFRRVAATGAVDYGRTDHWANFYGRKTAATAPSPFAQHCLPALAPGMRLLELGCGNGRDAMHFARNGLAVTAIDKSQAAIDACIDARGSLDIQYICCDASDLPRHAADGYDVVYSRFSLHAMTPQEEEQALAAAFAALNPGGSIWIECRSINDPLSRKGDVLSPTERIDGHYRRFIVLEELIGRIESLGLSVHERIESTGLAAYGDEDPVVIRVMAKKAG